MRPDAEAESVDLAALGQAAGRLVDSLTTRGVVWLSGDLGTGKTTFAQLMVAAAEGEGASSPSFTLVNEYASPGGPIYHADCYRLRSPEEALDLQLWELAGQGRFLLVEWPERAGEHAPPPDFVVSLEHENQPHLRRLRVRRC